MKTKIVLLTLLSILNLRCLAQDWHWAKSTGGLNQDGGKSICTDSNGNVYFAGQIMYPEAFFQTDTLIIVGFSDFFLAKYDGNGNELWVKQFGGYNSEGNFEYAHSLLYDANTNSVYMTGSFVGICQFGSYTLNSHSNNDKDAYIAKFDLNGNCIWAKSAGSGGNDACTGVAIYQNGSVIIGGYMPYGGTVGTINIPGGGFFAEYDNNGNCMWAKNIFNSATGAGTINIFDTDIFSEGNFTATDTVVIDTIHIPTVGYLRGKVLSRFDSAGHVKWARIFGYPEINSGWGFSMDAEGNCYIDGGFKGGYAVFGNDTIHSDTTDFFIAKYDRDGNFKWVRQSNSSLGASASSIYTDAIGNSYLTGGFSGNANFGGFNITSSAAGDGFIARYDSSGNCIGVRIIDHVGAVSITSDVNANVYITGAFKNTMDFGSTNLISHGNSDIFVAKSGVIVGIEELKAAKNNTLLIYANPTTGKCTVTVPDDFLNAQDLILTIFDNTGKIIQQRKLEMNEGKIKIDLEQEAKGIYNVTLGNGKKVYGGRVVFQ